MTFQAGGDRESILKAPSVTSQMPPVLLEEEPLQGSPVSPSESPTWGQAQGRDPVMCGV